VQEQDDFSTPSPWTRPWFITSAAFVGLLIVFAAVMAVRAAGGPSTHDPVVGDPTAATPTLTTPGSVLPTAIPTRAPTDVTWQLVGQSAVPVSSSAGPRSVSSGTASEYAHSPDGALVAAAQLCVRAGLSAGKASWEPTITHQFVSGPDRDRLLDALRAAPQAGAAPGELSALAGYIYQSYSPDTAVIGLVYRAPGTTAAYHVLTATMVWRDGDWRMVAPPGGSWLSVNRETTSLAGVVEWGAR
jgi:hypothetical protein